MPCDTVRIDESPEQARARADRAVNALEALLAGGAARVVLDPSTGALAFDAPAWTGAIRGGLTDACAYVMLAARGSWELRRAVAAAETLAGRTLDTGAIMAGRHSHDGGKTWSAKG